MILWSAGKACRVRRCQEWLGRGCVGAASGVGEGGDAGLDGLIAAGGHLVHVGELGAGAVEADFEPLGFAEPAVGFGFGDAGDEVVADLDQAWPDGRVWSQQWAAQAPLTELTAWFGQVGALSGWRADSLLG